MGEFGCVEPLVWNKRTGNLVGGHQRLKILVAKGEKKVDVSVVDLSIEREKALNVALNKVQGGWDEARLAELLDELSKLPDFDVTLTGFDMPEVEDLLAGVLNPGGEQREEVFDVEAELAKAGPVVTKPGELIELAAKGGPAVHRLLCGDSTDAAAVRRLMQGERAILFATDPPYLVGYDGTNHPGSNGKGVKRLMDGAARGSGAAAGRAAAKASRRGAGSRRGASLAPPRRDTKNKDWSDTYGVSWDDADGDPALYRGFIRAAIDEAILPNAAWYCWHASRRQAMLESVWNEAGAFAHCQVVWVKSRPVLTRTWFSWMHEPCLMGWMKGRKPPKVEKAVLPTVWQIPTIANGPERPDHPTPKPLELFEIPMRQHTRRGELCYEPFAGSGTQVIAAERLGRRCRAVEISPRYCDLIVRRFIAFIGERNADPALVKRYARRGASAARTKPTAAGAGARG